MSTIVSRRIFDDLAGNSAINPEIKKEPIRDDCIDNNNDTQTQQSMLTQNISQEMANHVNVLSSKYVFQNPGVSLYYFTPYNIHISLDLSWFIVT